jgi:hypothetical protein
MRCAHILWTVFILDILLALGVGIYGLMTAPNLVAFILAMIGASGVCGLVVAFISVHFCMPKEAEAEASTEVMTPASATYETV